MSVYTQTTQPYWSVSTWCRNVSAHLQNSFAVYFISLRCQMGGVYHIKEHNGHRRVQKFLVIVQKSVDCIFLSLTNHQAL